jgi:hypothetical protein
MWPIGHVGHVTYSFINMLFISRGIFDDKLRPQILSVGPFIILEITAVKIMNNLNVCSTHSYLFHGPSLNTDGHNQPPKKTWAFYIVSQLPLEQNIWQAWLLMFLHTKFSVLLKIIFFISLKTTKITSKIQIAGVFKRLIISIHSN